MMFFWIFLWVIGNLNELSMMKYIEKKLKLLIGFLTSQGIGSFPLYLSIVS